MKKILLALVSALLLLAPALPAQAHSVLLSSTPKSGSVLTASPQSLTLTFNESSTLTSVVVVTPGGERDLDFTAASGSHSFTTEAPQLANGRNEIKWRALSEDGHVIEGSIVVILRNA